MGVDSFNGPSGPFGPTLGPTEDLLFLGVAHLVDRRLRAPVYVAPARVDSGLSAVDGDLGRLELVTFLDDGARFV